MKATRSSETSVYNPTRRHIPEDGVLQPYKCFNKLALTSVTTWKKKEINTSYGRFSKDKLCEAARNLVSCLSHQCHHCWNAPRTSSLCSHPLFGLRKLSASVGECQWGQFFFPHGGIQWHASASYALPMSDAILPEYSSAALCRTATELTNYWRECSTSTIIPPASTSNVAEQRSEIGGIIFGGSCTGDNRLFHASCLGHSCVQAGPYNVAWRGEAKVKLTDTFRKYKGNADSDIHVAMCSNCVQLLCNLSSCDAVFCGAWRANNGKRNSTGASVLQ
jgi:hypothetical protein